MTAWSDIVGGDGSDVPVGEAFSVPNLITLSGYAAGLYWVAGGSPAFALWSVVADELDGESARNLGEASRMGDRLDSSVDMCMSAILAVASGMWWLAPVTLLVQVWLKDAEDWKPPVGSARAVQTLYILSRGGL